MLLFPILFSAAVFTTPVMDVRLETPEGRPFVSSDVEFTVDRVPGEDGVSTAVCRLKAKKAEKPVLVRIVASVSKRGSGLTMFDGRIEKPVRKGVSGNQLMRKSGTTAGYFAFGALWDEKLGVALGVGADGADSFVRLETRGEESSAGMEVIVNAALMREGSEYACKFHAIPFVPKYGQRDALARYYRLHPERFKRNPKVNRSVFGICAAYSSWNHADPEACRLMNATWEWCHGSDRSWGDMLNTVSPRPPHRGDFTYSPVIRYKLRNGKTVVKKNAELSREEFNAVQRSRFANGYLCGVANGFYMMGMSNISNIFADRYPDSVSGDHQILENPYPYSTYVYAFPECSWGKEVRRQLKELVRNEDIGSIAFDVSAPGGIYRGSRLAEMNNVGFDDFGPGVARAIANAGLCDFVSGLPCRKVPGNIASAVNTCPGQLHDILHADMTMIEAPPWTAEPPFPEVYRFAAGEKGVTYWEGYRPRDFAPDFYRWPKHLRDRMLRELARFAVHQQFRWGISLNGSFISEYVSRVSGAFVRCNDAGWKPVPASRVCDTNRFAVTRYGLGERSYLAVNNLSRTPSTVRLTVHPDELRSGFVGTSASSVPVVFASYFGGDCVNRLSKGGEEVEFAVGAQLTGLLEAVGSATGDGCLKVSWRKKGIDVRLVLESVSFSGRVRLRDSFEGWRRDGAPEHVLAPGKSIDVAYRDPAFAAVAGGISDFGFTKDGKTLFSMKYSDDGGDSRDMADRVNVFFGTVMRQTVPGGKSSPRMPVKCEADGNLPPRTVQLTDPDGRTIRISDPDREGFSVLTRRFLDAVNELRYPEYFLGLSMEESERPFISRNPRF